jgi:hypothetical protein
MKQSELRQLIKEEIKLLSERTLKAFFKEFPNNTKKWMEATDEIRDIARTAKELYNEYEGHDYPALNFRAIKTPSEWNTKGKKYILTLYKKMGAETKENFEKYLYDHFNIKG